MNINYEKLEKKFWFEDSCGNEVNADDLNAYYYIRQNPLAFVKYVDEYRYYPRNPIIRFLSDRSKKFYKWISKGKPKTFRNLFVVSATYSYEQECIIAMVNSGDFTLEQAIWVYANSCERCMNSLLYKYLNGKKGYEEFSEEWKKCNTTCDFCKGD